jgi:hypothetical protein
VTLNAAVDPGAAAGSVRFSGQPLVILVHYDGNDGVPYGMAVYTEGDVDVKEFKTRQGRDHATDEWAVWWWKFSEAEGAPTKLSDGRLGPYRRYG